MGEGQAYNYPATKEGRAELGEFGKVKLKEIISEKGTRVSVNAAIADDALGLINEMESRGYNIKNISSYNPRKMRGKKSLSMHGWAAAIDFNPYENPFEDWANYSPGKTDMPENMKYLFMKYGFSQLGSDRMHIERVSPAKRRAYLEYLVRENIIPRDDPLVQRKIAEGVISEDFIKSLPPVVSVEPEAPPVESVEVQTQPDVTGQPIPQPSGPSGSSIIPDQPESPPPVSKRSIATYAGLTTTPETPATPAAAPAPPAATATPTPEPTKSSDLLPDASDPKVQKAMENATPTGEDYRETVEKMQYGGTKQSPTGEPLGAVDMKTGKLMFTHQPGESVNYDKSGQIKVTPNQRRDSQEIESLAQRVKDEVRLDSEAREEAAKTQTSQMTPNPVVNRDWPDTVKALSQESSNVYKTPSSARAFDQARFSGRKDMFSLGEANLKV
jgi:hypothetical protein